MMQWFIGSDLYGGPIELFLVPASAPMTGVTKAMVYAIRSGMVHIKDPLSSPSSGSSRFPLSLSEWSFTICSTSYNCIKMCCVVK